MNSSVNPHLDSGQGGGPTPPDVSIVVPAYNEQDGIYETLRRLTEIAVENFGDDFELIVIDDGSRDGTAHIVQQLMASNHRLRLLRLQRNSGHMEALTAGYEAAKGNYVVTIDADLQDPPEGIPEMVSLAKSHRLDVVYGVRGDRTSDTFFKRTTAGIYYSTVKRITGVNLPSGAADFRLVSRRVVDAFSGLPREERVYRLLVPWLDFPSGAIEYARSPRRAGESHYSISRMVSLAVNSILSFSSLPLRMVTYVGLAGLLASLLLVVLALGTYASGRVVPGWTSTILAIAFFGALNLAAVGLLGEWLIRIRQLLLRRTTPAYEVVWRGNPEA